MKLILGIGNPGKMYSHTRHNAGLLFVQWLAKKKYNLMPDTNSSKYIKYTIDDTHLLCTSLTYMNLSGKALEAIKKKYSIKPQDILIAHDDLEHRVGNVRIKDGGSTQGHNGIQSIAGSLKTKNIKRLQFGIDRPNSRDPQIVSKYVLAKFTQDQLKMLESSFVKGFQLAKKDNFL